MKKITEREKSARGKQRAAGIFLGLFTPMKGLTHQFENCWSVLHILFIMNILGKGDIFLMKCLALERVQHKWAVGLLSALQQEFTKNFF